MRIQYANKIKRMYKCAVFRQQVKTFLNTIKILKRNMFYLVDKIRHRILNKKANLIQKYIKKYLL